MSLLVIKITGKAFDEGTPLLDRYASTLKKLLETYKLLIVTGGGNTARKYMSVAKDLGVHSAYWLDSIGIMASRLNSLLLIASLSPHAYPRVPSTVEDTITALSSHRAVSVGGLIPGQSTAAVLLQVAEALAVRKVYYYSAIGKVYTKDPVKHPDAKPLSVIPASTLKAIIEQRNLPGEYALVDVSALDIAVRSKIEVQILNYREPELIYSALNGGNPGTIITPE
ncbi:MAG: UMP kinase [Desulfurococcaceae archaeon]